MPKTILLTGATDGIGLETAKGLYDDGHTLLIHGRNATKLEQIAKDLRQRRPGADQLTTYQADLSNLSAVQAMADQISHDHETLDVIINNAGVYKLSDPETDYGIDARFVVNTIAPFLLTDRLLPSVPAGGRVVNLSSAAQEPVSLDALQGRPSTLEDFSAYAQSKLALTMWTNALAAKTPDKVITSVNPGSLLATKMVREGFGMPGHDIAIGRRIVIDAATSERFAVANGRYWDNDAKAFADPHPNALDSANNEAVLNTIASLLKQRGFSSVA